VEEHLQELKRRIEAHLTAATGAPARVVELAPLAGGACQDNFRVDTALQSPGQGEARRLVLRSDAAGSLAGSLSRREEFRVIGAACAAGVKTPAARWLAQGLVREGAYAYFLDWVEGDAIGRRVVRDERLAGARRGLAGELADVLAKIHAITPDAAGLTDALAPPEDGDAAGAALRATRASLDALPEPRPALELAFEWLADNKPAPRPVVLVHGDFRTGNFMVTPAGLSAVLDWEFSRFGAPEEDIAWLSLRDWRFGMDALPIGGFARREEFYAAYEAASGRKVRRRDVHWWEVHGNVRWAMGCIQQGERYAKGEHDLELIAIPLRAAEMEFEALRLVQEGPPPDAAGEER
jgi:aminoglycoside phosphotransferase (APT) family kinase protein